MTGHAEDPFLWHIALGVEARYFLGDYDPMEETETGGLGWVDDKQKGLELTAWIVECVEAASGQRLDF